MTTYNWPYYPSHNEHIGWNIPGYLPEMGVMVAYTFNEARDILLEEMNRVIEGVVASYDADETDAQETVSMGVEVVELETAMILLRSLKSVSDCFYAEISGIAYWIEPCDDDGPCGFDDPEVTA